MYCDGKVCVVLLVGIPGSGKSFFRKFFETFLCGNTESVLGSVQVWSVCYDDFEPMRRGNSNWKKCRLDIMTIVCNLIEHLKSQDSLIKGFNKESSGICLINKELVSPDSILILIDDNMYYRSMRYEYYKLARVHNISFSQIFFEVDLQKALKCNSERSAGSRVPETVVENMYRKLEPPQANHLWEKFSISVLSYADFQNLDIVTKILSCLRTALDNPVRVRDVNSNEEEAFHVTTSNAFHQIDNTLKQLVAGHIKSQISAGNKSDLHFISKVFSERRLKLLNQIKRRVVTLPIDLNEAITKEKINLVKPMLSNLLFSD